MMDSPKKNIDELLELLSAAWDERLDAESFARLEELLDIDEGGSREVLVAFSRLQVELAWLAASSRSHEKSLSMLEPYFAQSKKAASKMEGSLVDAPQASSVRSKGSSGSSGLSKRTFLAIAAGVLMPMAALTWYFLSANSPSGPVVEPGWLVRAPHRVARLASVEDAVWKKGARKHGTGDLLAEGERLHLESGTAQVSMACGAEVLLQAPCSVELTSEKLVRLESGKLTSQVAKWGKGFIVEAGGLRVTDLGTRFAVLAPSPDTAEAHVLQGAVRAELIPTRNGLKQGKSQVLRTGGAVKWSSANSRLDPIAVDISRFAETLPQFRPLYPIKVANTGQSLSIGSRDPRWRISGGHESGGSFPVSATVGRPTVVYLDNASIQSQWISVRGGITRGVAPLTQYTFETTFDLTGVDPTTVHLVGQILVDNRLQEIRLNGKPVDVAPWDSYSSEDFQRFHLVNIRDGFSAGVNRLEFDVINGGVNSDSRNPMALRAEWQAFGCVAGG